MNSKQNESSAAKRYGVAAGVGGSLIGGAIAAERANEMYGFNKEMKGFINLQGQKKSLTDALREANKSTLKEYAKKSVNPILKATGKGALIGTALYGGYRGAKHLLKKESSNMEKRSAFDQGFVDGYEAYMEKVANNGKHERDEGPSGRRWVGIPTATGAAAGAGGGAYLHGGFIRGVNSLMSNPYVPLEVQGAGKTFLAKIPGKGKIALLSGALGAGGAALASSTLYGAARHGYNRGVNRDKKDD